MEHRRPSATAYRVALRRAAHQILDHPVVLVDPIALRIVGPRGEASIRSEPRRYQSGFGRSLRAFLVARSRCAEDALAAAFHRGVRQYVVLGAGLDTFAYRNPHGDALHVFEVDHPATQTWKRELLGAARIDLPRSLAFVPVDFESQSLPMRLTESGFRLDAPAFFSWLGVTMYLSAGAAEATLAWIAGCPTASGITLDYLVPPSSLPLLRRIGFHLLARRLAAIGEPWRSWFDPADLAGRLREMGYTALEDLDAQTLNQRYFSGRERALGGRSVGRVMTALRLTSP